MGCKYGQITNKGKISFLGPSNYYLLAAYARLMRNQGTTYSSPVSIALKSGACPLQGSTRLINCSSLGRNYCHGSEVHILLSHLYSRSFWANVLSITSRSKGTTCYITRLLSFRQRSSSSLIEKCEILSLLGGTGSNS